MGKQLKRENIIYGFLALLCFALLYAVTYPGNADAAEGRQEVKIVAFGDSVFGEVRDNTAVPVLLQDILGESIYNAWRDWKRTGGWIMRRILFRWWA